jgi:hypothetical protein
MGFWDVQPRHILKKEKSSYGRNFPCGAFRDHQKIIDKETNDIGLFISRSNDDDLGDALSELF